MMRMYKIDECCTFRKGSDEFGAFGNMTGGYPITHNGKIWKSSEALYQAARFPDHPDIQEEIRNATNGFTAKLVAKANKEHTRADWDDGVNVHAMRHVMSLKTQQHSMIVDLLKQTGDREIVEISGKGDQFWGTKILSEYPEYVVGNNALGKLWMYIRARLDFYLPFDVAPAGLLPGTADKFEEFTR